MRQPAELLPGVDLEEIEDEFEELHRCRFFLTKSLQMFLQNSIFL